MNLLHHFMKSAKMMSVMKAASSRRAEKALKEILDKAGYSFKLLSIDA